MQTVIFAGDTLKFDADYPDYPSSTWTLTYRLIPETGTVLSFNATASGSAYAVSVAAATTGAWAPKDYAWIAYVTSGSERHTVDRGRTTVKPDPSSSAGYDSRSDARQGLDAIRAVLKGKASKDQSQYQINGRMITRYSPTELLVLESYFQMRVDTEERAERAGNGLPDKRRTYVRFANRA